MDTALNLPPAIAHYLITLAAQQRDIAYLQVSTEGCILSSGGALTKYSLGAAKVGDEIDQHLLFLAGFFPHLHDNEVMPYIQTEQGEVVNVHFIAYDGDRTPKKAPESKANPASTEQWILLIDATAEIKQQQQFQQVANDLTLLRQQLTKQIDQTHHQISVPVARSTGTLIYQSQNTPSANSEPSANNEPSANSEPSASSSSAQKVSILVIKIRQSPFTITRLNSYFADIAQLVLEESGLIHHVFGPNAVALFGLTPTTSRPPAVQAARAAKRVLRRFAPEPTASPATAENSEPDPCQIILSITTGDATIGTINQTNRQTLNVDGPAVATSMTMRDLPMEGLCHQHSHHSFIVDEPTLQASHGELGGFSRRRLLQGDQPPPLLYQLIPK